MIGFFFFVGFSVTISGRRKRDKNIGRFTISREISHVWSSDTFSQKLAVELPDVNFDLLSIIETVLIKFQSEVLNTQI